MKNDSKRTILFVVSIMVLFILVSKIKEGSKSDATGKEFSILGTWYNHKGETFQHKMDVFEDGNFVEYEDQANFETNHAGWKEYRKGQWKREDFQDGTIYKFVGKNDGSGTSYSVNSWNNLEYKDFGQNIMIIWTR